MFSYCPGLTRRVWYPGMGYRGLHLQHVLTWTPKVAKATSVAANEEGCYGDTGKRSVTLFSGSVARSLRRSASPAWLGIANFKLGAIVTASSLRQGIYLRACERAGRPYPGGRLSQSQPEWMDPSPQVLGIRHVTALQLGSHYSSCIHSPLIPSTEAHVQAGILVSTRGALAASGFYLRRTHLQHTREPHSRSIPGLSIRMAVE